MSASREPVATVGFIDAAANDYRDLLCDIRQYECLKWLLVGILSVLPRKSLPAIAKLVGLKDSQSLHHFLRDSVWSVDQLRQRRLRCIQQQIGQRGITLCIDETGDVKKGRATDYASKQYIGNLGCTANGVVSVNAYAVVDEITYPLLFRIYKPKRRLKPDDVYKTKPEIAVELIREIHQMGFVIERVLADSLYGEAWSVIRLIERELQLPYIVAIRSNHGRMMMPGHRIRYNRWRAYDQPLSNHPTQRRYIREIIFGERAEVRYFQITKGMTDDPEHCDRWSIMTNLPGKIILTVGRQYSWRNWIEYGFKQVKDELGWHDYRLTDYASIERWWELIFLAYLLVSLQAEEFKRQRDADDEADMPPTQTDLRFAQHPHWEAGCNWKSALNNLRLILQPYCCWAWIELWLHVVSIPGLRRAMQRLMRWMDTYQIRPSPQPLRNAA